MKDGLRKFYDTLYKDKTKKGYKQEHAQRSKDFLHRYMLFFLDPHKNTRHEIVKKILPSGVRTRCLDIGCWTGDSTISYGVLEKFKEVHALEISQEAAAEAKGKGINVSVCDINAENLPFPDNFFDCITFIAVIEHLVDPFHILKEIKRVLKKEGTLIIGTVNVASLSNRIKILTGRRPRTSFDIGWDGGHLLYFIPKEFRNLLNDYGFEVVKKYATGNLQFIRRFLFPFTGEFIFKCKIK